MTSERVPHEADLRRYYEALSQAAELGNRLAAEPSEHEVAELLRRRGTAPTPAAIAAWYETEHRAEGDPPQP